VLRAFVHPAYFRLRRELGAITARLMRRLAKAQASLFDDNPSALVARLLMMLDQGGYETLLGVAYYENPEHLLGERATQKKLADLAVALFERDYRYEGMNIALAIASLTPPKDRPHLMRLLTPLALRAAGFYVRDLRAWPCGVTAPVDPPAAKAALEKLARTADPVARDALVWAFLDACQVDRIDLTKSTPPFFRPPEIKEGVTLLEGYRLIMRQPKAMTGPFCVTYLSLLTAGLINASERVDPGACQNLPPPFVSAVGAALAKEYRSAACEVFRFVASTAHQEPAVLDGVAWRTERGVARLAATREGGLRLVLDTGAVDDSSLPTRPVEHKARLAQALLTRLWPDRRDDPSLQPF
jgi:hypothetical protein